MVALLGFFFGVIEFAKKMPTDIMKICIFGDAATGKTSIGKQYVDGRCTDGYTATIGADFFIKHMTVDGKDKRLQIWGLAQHNNTHSLLHCTRLTTLWADTAGQEMFRSISTSLFKNAHAVIIVFDVTSRESLLGCDRWVQDMIASKSTDIVFVAVGNKIDLAESREVSTEEARAHFEAMSPSPLYFETSALTGEGIEELFGSVVNMVLERSTASLSNDNTNRDQGAQRSKCIIC